MSYHRTSTQGAQAVVKFNGTGIQVFGSKRSTYGSFNLQVDGGSTFVCNGTSSGNPLFQQLLCSTRLSNGPHTAVLTNLQNSPVDIDNIVLFGEIGQAGAQLSVASFDDNDAAMVYTPSPQAWNFNNGSAFMNNTLHYTQMPGATASMQFNGDAVAVYGTVSPDHADIQVTLDGQMMPLLPGGSGGRVSALHTKVLLFFANGLGRGLHKVALSGNTNTTTGPFIDVDAIQVYTSTVSSLNSSSPAVPSVSPVSVTTLPTPNSMSSATSTTVRSSSGVSKAAIIGASIGGVVVLLLAVFTLLWFLLCRRRRRTDNSISRLTKAMIGSPKSPQLPMQRDPEAGYIPAGPESIAFPMPPAVVRRSDSRHSIAPSYYGSFPDNMTQTSHTRDESASSSNSTMPLIPPVPAVPKVGLPVARKPAPNISGMVTEVSTPPIRPTRPILLVAGQSIGS
ncbi:hypothetical protein BDQ17DRAFT_930237 [Cyathus striatus]|nr:hypothetical protein BDQ17DRAFT_930237 [Cyathus striatus]